jgi:hypothetical protein
MKRILIDIPNKDYDILMKYCIIHNESINKYIQRLIKNSYIKIEIGGKENE